MEVQLSQAASLAGFAIGSFKIDRQPQRCGGPRATPATVLPEPAAASKARSGRRRTAAKSRSAVDFASRCVTTQPMCCGRQSRQCRMCSHQRQLHAKLRHPLAALPADRAAVVFGDLPGDEEAQTRALGLAGHEGLEEPRGDLGRGTGTAVANHQRSDRGTRLPGTRLRVAGRRSAPAPPRSAPAIARGRSRRPRRSAPGSRPTASVPPRRPARLTARPA